VEISSPHLPPPPKAHPGKAAAPAHFLPHGFGRGKWLCFHCVVFLCFPEEIIQNGQIRNRGGKDFFPLEQHFCGRYCQDKDILIGESFILFGSFHQVILHCKDIASYIYDSIVFFYGLSDHIFGIEQDAFFCDGAIIDRVIPVAVSAIDKVIIE
jgi:hypothetical protein